MVWDVLGMAVGGGVKIFCVKIGKRDFKIYHKFLCFMSKNTPYFWKSFLFQSWYTLQINLYTSSHLLWTKSQKVQLETQTVTQRNLKLKRFIKCETKHASFILNEFFKKFSFLFVQNLNFAKRIRKVSLTHFSSCFILRCTTSK